MSDCARNSYPEFIHRNRLIHKELKNDTLTLQVGIVRNCSFLPIVDLNFDEDTLVLKISNTSCDYAACDCCYELELRIVGIPDTNFTLGEKFLNNELVDYTNFDDFVHQEFSEWTEFEEFRYFHNKFIFPTLEEVEAITEYNQFNADSLKIGMWIEYSRRYLNNYSKVFYFIDDLGKSHAKWSIDYNEKNEILHASALTGFDGKGIPNRLSIEGKMYLNMMSTKQ